MSRIDRYKILIRYLTKIGVVANQRELGQKMGYNNPSAFSQVINGKAKEPKLFTQKLKCIVPELSLDWLNDGIGNMLETDIGQNEKTQFASGLISEIETERSDKETVNYVYLLPISAQGGSLDDFVVSVKDSDCEKVISPIAGADYAITIAGDSMAPEYPNGSQILIKKINERAFIDWGKAYVLDTCNGVVVKILVPSKRDGYVRCLSLNPDPMYAPFEVALEDLFGVYRVMLCMSVK